MVSDFGCDSFWQVLEAVQIFSVLSGVFPGDLLDVLFMDEFSIAL